MAPSEAKGMSKGPTAPPAPRWNKQEVTKIRGEIFIHDAALCEPLRGCHPQPEQPPVTLDYLKGLGPLSMLAPLSRTCESSILPMQTRLPLTLSLTFCNHEILMTNIEFKVQFVSGSFGGKGSCKGIVLGGGVGAGEPRMGEGTEMRGLKACSSRASKCP